MPLRIAWSVAVLALVGCATSQVAQHADERVRTALADRYPAEKATRAGDLIFDRDSRLVMVHSPALDRAIPGVRFYVTELQTGHMEYSEVEAIVAAPTDGPLSVCLSPLYETPDPAFVATLCRARISRPADARAVANEIAGLFAAITYEGKIRDPKNEPGRFVADLWHGDLLWRRISIVFSEGRVSSVTLANPKENSPASVGATQPSRG